MTTTQDEVDLDLMMKLGFHQLKKVQMILIIFPLMF